MLDKEGFNKWSGNYDKSILNSSDKYPFQGYYDVLGEIENTVRVSLSESKVVEVLDLGIGTGTLTSQLYNHGVEITGIDFSEDMINIARSKMPEADFSVMILH